MGHISAEMTHPENLHDAVKVSLIATHGVIAHEPHDG